jgi:DNA-binding winged helix-turn-helix (wHTH) protein
LILPTNDIGTLSSAGLIGSAGRGLALPFSLLTSWIQDLESSKISQDGWYFSVIESGTKGDQSDICFWRWRLSPANRRLLTDGIPVALGGRTFDVLLALVEARGEIVTKEALMRRVWFGRCHRGQ